MQRRNIKSRTMYSYGDIVRTPEGRLAVVDDVDDGIASIALLNASTEKTYGWEWGDLILVDLSILDESDSLFEYWRQKCKDVGVIIEQCDPFDKSGLEEYKKQQIEDMLELLYEERE